MLSKEREQRLHIILSILDHEAGAEGGIVRDRVWRRTGLALTIDTIQRDLHVLIERGFVDASRNRDDPFWYTLTQKGRDQLCFLC